MKNFINYYYHIYPSKIYNGEYFFMSKNKVYIKKYKGSMKNLDKLFNISNELYNLGINVDTFILNNNKEYYTKKDDEIIVLLKVNDTEREEIVLEEILLSKYNIDNKLDALNVCDVIKNIVDTLELEMIEYNKEYQLIQNSINYYIGLSENAIQLLNDSIKLDNKKYSICHNIELSNYSKKEIYNPLNFISSNIMFDIANYVKYSFFNNNINYDEIEDIVFSNDYDEYDIRIFYSNLLFPNYYFECIRHILLEEEKEEIIKKYINRVNNYEKFLYECKEIIRKKYNFLNITWLDKNY